MHIMMKRLGKFPAYGLLNGIIRFTKSTALVSHGRYGVSDHWQLYWLFSSFSRKSSKKTKCPYYRPFVRGIHYSLVFSPNQGTVMWKVSHYFNRNSLLGNKPFSWWPISLMHMHQWTSRNSLIFINGYITLSLFHWPTCCTSATPEVRATDYRCEYLKGTAQAMPLWWL